MDLAEEWELVARSFGASSKYGGTVKIGVVCV